MYSRHACTSRQVRARLLFMMSPHVMMIQAARRLVGYGQQKHEYMHEREEGHSNSCRNALFFLAQRCSDTHRRSCSTGGGGGGDGELGLIPVWRCPVNRWKKPREAAKIFNNGEGRKRCDGWWCAFVCLRWIQCECGYDNTTSTRFSGFVLLR